MLIFASWSEKFRDAIGLEGASQVWGPRPAWYFWLTNAPGVYCLELVDASETKSKHRKFITGQFTIKCYPYPHNGHFKSFSFVEQALVQSHFFDDTHTPAFEYQSDLPANLFNIGAFELTLDHNDGVVLFSFETLDRLRTRYTNKAVATYPDLDIERPFRKGEVDRNVPGTKLGHPMFDCLLCLFANASKRTPFQVQCARFAGFEIKVRPDEASPVRSDRIKGYRLRVLYASRHDRQGLALLKGGRGINAREDIFYNRKFIDGHYHDHAGHEFLPLEINPQWWQVAVAHYHSELASTCGCH